jgi:hypothetical protein
VLGVDRTPTEQASSATSPSGAPDLESTSSVSIPRSRAQRTYTTHDLARRCGELLHRAAEHRANTARIAPSTVEQVIAQRPELSTEERAIRRAACTSGDLFQPIAEGPK